jgi:hypothetical protein
MRNTGAVYRFDIYLQGERETVFFDVWSSTRRLASQWRIR